MIEFSKEKYVGLVNRMAQNWSPHALPSRAKAPVVSFSFDDFPRSAAKEGAAILAKFGIKGTFFVAGGRLGSRVDGLDYFTEKDLIEVAVAGHEIGCHTFGHIRLPETGRAEIEKDLMRNKIFVQGILGDYTMSSFAYPYGHVNIATKATLGRHFPICRGIQPGMNKARIDFAQLRAIVLDAACNFDRLPKLLDNAVTQNGWLIFFTHDISKNPSPYGCKPEELAKLVQDVIARGIEVLPVKNAVGKMRFS